MSTVRRIAWNVIPLAGIWSLTACSSGLSPATAQTVSGDKICTTERSLGSHMPQRVCRSKEQVEAERKAASATLTQLGKSSSASLEQQ